MADGGQPQQTKKVSQQNHIRTRDHQYSVTGGVMSVSKSIRSTSV